MSYKCDVLIVGAGPAGLMAALWLSRLNVKTRIIDKRATKVMNGQADGLQPRLNEIFASFGLWSGIKDDANEVFDMATWSESPEGKLKRDAKQVAAYATMATHTMYLLNQGENEKHMLAGISKSSDIEVERSTLPVAISIDESLVDDPEAYPVTVEVQRLNEDETAAFHTKSFAKNGEVTDGLHRSNLTADTTPQLVEKVASREETKEIIQAKYVLGSEGAHSWVRQQLGFELEGESTDYIWGVLDVIPFTDFPDIRTVCMIQSKQGAMLTIPRENKLVRLYVQMAEVDPKNGREEARSKVNPDSILASAKRIMSPWKIDYKYCDWWTAYQIGQRVSTGFQDKHSRVFLAGDAVHTHSPKAGQGMNVSMQDGYNLGWKLGSVINGWAPQSILQTYEPERRKVAQDLIAFDHRLAAVFSGAPSPEELQEVYVTNMIFLCGYGVHYPPSLLTAKSDSNKQLQPITDPSNIAAASSNYASKIKLGEVLGPCPVLIHSTARPVDLGYLMPSDGRWRLIVFPGDISTDTSLARLNQLGDRLAPVVKQYTISRPSKHIHNGAHQNALPKTMSQSLIDVHVVHSASRQPGSLEVQARDLNEFHPLFFPSDEYSGYDYEKVFVDTDMTVYNCVSGGPGLQNAGKLYDILGISKEEGAMVIVRPDQYAAWVGGFEDVVGVKRFFGGVLKQQVHQNGHTNGLTNGHAA